MKNPIEYFDYEDRLLIVYFLSLVVCLAIGALPCGVGFSKISTN